MIRRSWLLTRLDASRAEDQPDAGYALVLVMLLILIITTISLTALGYTLNQVGPTQLARKNVQTVNSANAGLQAGLSLLRSATVSGSGNVTKLPCTGTGALLQGPVQGSSDGNRYSTRIRYFAKGMDPTGQSAAWLTANALSCPLSQAPFYALLENSSTSTAAPVGRSQRSVRATYNFKTTNVNASGGRVFDGSGSLCWDVGSSPAVGSAVSWQPCLASGAPQQTWAYRGDMDLYWAGGGSTSNLCLDYRSYAVNSPNPTTAGITLQTCLNPNGTPGSTYPYNPALEQYQEFASQVQFFGVESDGERSFSDCIGNSTRDQPAVGATLTMTPSGCNGVRPENAVGSGAAAGTITGLPGPTKQLVNYAQYGMCLDVKNSRPSNQYLIVYPCHQAADPNKVEGNQQFVFNGSSSGTGTFTGTRTDSPDSQYNYPVLCMYSPAAPATKVGLVSCDGTAPQQWTFTGPVDNDYDSSYNIRDNTGRCLGLANPDGNSDGYMFAVMQTCDGSDQQKWNAPPGLRPQAVMGIVETTGLS